MPDYTFSTALSLLQSEYALLSDTKTPTTFYTTLIDQGDPFPFLVATCTLISLLTYLHALTTGLTYMVDRVWSMLPPLYLSVYTSWSFLTSPVAHPRQVVQLLIAILWGLRLTYNFARKRGYDGSEEDYRWAHIRQWKLMKIGVVSQVSTSMLVFHFSEKK